jgi:3D-(3,5/4)-trihydroxycyclohexane-1,2-dione acylhydrolase (decyclizing)
MMVCSSSIGPGATNMVTAAALAHVDRLPVLFLPGDVFAWRRPDPVLQQLEDFGDATVSVNDCFRPVSRYFDRITRSEQLLTALPRAISVLTDPAECGPATLALCQDTQSEAFDWPEAFFAPHVWRVRRPSPDAAELAGAVRALRAARAPLIVAGGGVLYSEATSTLARFVETHGIPVTETQAGKGALAYDHRLNLGAIGVTGTSAANRAAANADVVLVIGARLQDFTTGSRTLLGGRVIALNVQQFDAGKHDAQPLVADAREGLMALDIALGRTWTVLFAGHMDRCRRRVARRVANPDGRRHRAWRCRAADRRAGDRRGAARGVIQRRGGLRRGWIAGRTAQAVASRRARQLPSGIRLLLYGL